MIKTSGPGRVLNVRVQDRVSSHPSLRPRPWICGLETKTGLEYCYYTDICLATCSLLRQGIWKWNADIAFLLGGADLSAAVVVLPHFMFRVSQKFYMNSSNLILICKVLKFWKQCAHAGSAGSHCLLMWYPFVIMWSCTWFSSISQ